MIGHQPSPQAMLPTYTVLLVDAGAANRQRYQRWLQQDWRCTYTTIPLETGESVLQWCQSAFPDLILLDYDLSDGTGLEILQRLSQPKTQQMESDRPLPVILLIPAQTASDQHPMPLAMQAIHQGAQDFLLKEQLTADLLCRTAYSVVERGRLTTQVQALTAQLDSHTTQLARQGANPFQDEEVLCCQPSDEALRQSEAMNRAIRDALPDLLICMKRDGTYLDIKLTDAFPMIWATSVKIGQNVREVLPPNAAIDRLAAIERALQTRSLQTYEMNFTMGDQPYCQEVRIMPLLADEVLVLIRDMSDRKRTEKALAESEAHYRAILQDQTELIIRYRPDGTMLFANDAFCRYFSYSYDDIVGKPYEPVIFADDREHVAHLIQSLSADNPLVVIENRVMVGEKIRWTQWVNRMIFDERGQFVEYQAVGRDIHDLKQVELELQQAKEAAEVATRMKSLFLANMSHELRTPLNVILGFAQVMSHDVSLSAEQQEHLHIIHRSGDHLLHLINNILDLSKIEAERMILDERAFDLMALLETLHTMFSQRAQAKGLHLRVDLASDLPPWVIADANKLQQILMNLLSNAIKFTEQGCITLRVMVNCDPAANKQLHPISDRPTGAISLVPSSGSTLLHFEVEDTGIGIASDDLPKIFSAFVQAPTNPNTTEGTGLGLTISGKFVELMGGYLLASSTLGQGSLFSFDISVQLPGTEEVPKGNGRRQIVGIAPGQPPYRILVVDDQPDNRQLMVKILTQFGLEVQAATNGEEAVECWKQWYPHLILMDLRMPHLDGYEATRQIRAMQQRFTATFDRPHPLIIALTAQASNRDRALALAAGCNDFVCKPFRVDDLFAMMETHLGLRYLYVEPQVAISSPSSYAASPPIAADDLAIMSPNWIANLHRSALDCDDEAALRLVQDIPDAYPELISGLRRLIHHYQFRAIAHLTTAFNEI